MLPGSQAPYITTIAKLQARTQWWSQCSGNIISLHPMALRRLYPSLLGNIYYWCPVAQYVAFIVAQSQQGVSPSGSLPTALLSIRCFYATVQFSINGQFVCFLSSRAAHFNIFSHNSGIVKTALQPIAILSLFAAQFHEFNGSCFCLDRVGR